MTVNVQPRTCAVCNSPLISKRQDSITCTGRCRTKLYRQRASNTVVVKVRLPLDAYKVIVNRLMPSGKVNAVDKYVQSLLQRARHA